MKDNLYAQINKLYDSLKINSGTTVIRNTIHAGTLNNRLHTEFSGSNSKQSDIVVTNNIKGMP